MLRKGAKVQWITAGFVPMSYVSAYVARGECGGGAEGKGGWRVGGRWIMVG